MKLLLFSLSLSFFIIISECRDIKWNTVSDNKELLQTHVIFRHGERTTDRFYPNDPHINNSFYPIGKGGLTNNGKLGEYKLGQFLRKEYDTLLGTIYSHEDVEVRSTNTVRTIMSAQLVLAGLYPPVGEQIWHPEFHWQPIPVFSKLKPEEDLMHPEVCEKKLAVYDDLPTRPEIYQHFIKPNEKLFKFVEEKSGMPIRNPHDLIDFYFIVNTEDDMHMGLPLWVHQVYPEQIYSTASLTYSYLNVDNDIKKINAGYLMKKIINDALKMTTGHRNNDDVRGDDKAKKMYLYSGHESTLGYLLFAMDVLKPHIPSYGSAILMDLYKDQLDHDYYIKVRYRDSPTADSAMDFVLPGCKGSSYCPLKKFIELQRHYLPTVSIQEACKLDKNLH